MAHAAPDRDTARKIPPSNCGSRLSRRSPVAESAMLSAVSAAVRSDSQVEDAESNVVAPHS